MQNRTITLPIFAVALISAILVSEAESSLIYSDSFNGGGVSDPLNGQTLDVTTGGATWTAGTVFTTNGTEVVGGNPAMTAYLPFTPSPGAIYTLTATLDQTAGGGWSALGFPTTVGTGPWLGTSPAAWMLVRGGGSVELRKTWPGDAVTPAPSALNGFNTWEIILDTRPALWEVEWKRNGISLHSDTYTTNPSIKGVGFGTHSSGTIRLDDFSLAVVVPEPSTTAVLFGLLSLSLFGRRRRRFRTLS